MLLRDLGADVTTLARPVGAGDPDGLDAATAGVLTRGRRVVEVDLKDDGGHRIARGLIADAHGLVEGFRPGVTERLGLHPAPCLVLNPRLVYGWMTGWGRTGRTPSSRATTSTTSP